jgi:hypothetical protein
MLDEVFLQSKHHNAEYAAIKALDRPH